MARDISKIAKKINNDEYYTPKYIVEILMDFVNKRFTKPTICCPFDNQNSEFVLYCKKHFIDVKYGHIKTGQDLFDYNYGEYDICISNPPFSKKLDVFKKLDRDNKPWAMLMNCMALNYHEIINYFIDNEPDILFFNKRVSFNGNPTAFGSCFVSRGILPKQIICYSIPHNNTGVNFMRSKMYGGI
jgi:hypothetical protein